MLAMGFSFGYDLVRGLPPYDPPDDAFGKIGVWSVMISWFMIFALLIWRLLFGSAANAFFARPDVPE
jgi:hypothetical protein